MLQVRDETFLVVVSRMHLRLVQNQERLASNGNEDENHFRARTRNAEEPQKAKRTIIGDDALHRLQNSVTSQGMRISNASGC